jgi:hypothetical protein
MEDVFIVLTPVCFVGFTATDLERPNRLTRVRPSAPRYLRGAAHSCTFNSCTRLIEASWVGLYASPFVAPTKPATAADARVALLVGDGNIARPLSDMPTVSPPWCLSGHENVASPVPKCPAGSGCQALSTVFLGIALPSGLVEKRSRTLLKAAIPAAKAVSIGAHSSSRVFCLLSTMHSGPTHKNTGGAKDIEAKVYAWNDRKQRFSRRQIEICLEMLRAKG